MIKEKEKEQEYKLTTLDRCDRCGSQALVWVKSVSGELFFCGHHFAAHEEKLKNWSFEIIDEREKLIKK